MRFFVGIHQPNQAKHFKRVCISINRIRNRKSDFPCSDWIMDSGAFTEISTHGAYRHEPEEYAEQVRRWAKCGNMLAAVSQDYMCEPFIIEKAGLTVREHQQRTVDRYLAIRGACPGIYIMPVLQGYSANDYQRHVAMYGALLSHGAWVGVGSVCKRNGNIGPMLSVVRAIKELRPDLRLHGLGVKLTSLGEGAIRDSFWSADYMAWSFAARYEGRNPNCWTEARRFAERIENMPVQETMLI